MKAIVIDDNFNARDITRIVLSTCGFEVTPYSDPVTACEHLESQTYDLAVIDLQMPILDGRAVLRRIKANPIHQSMTIVVLTANSHMVTEEIDNIAHFTMQKPIHIQQFKAFINRISADWSRQTRM